jgi:hypothetical protein
MNTVKASLITKMRINFNNNSNSKRNWRSNKGSFKKLKPERDNSKKKRSVSRESVNKLKLKRKREDRYS